jgi:molybdate transport system substrate-binding protein
VTEKLDILCAGGFRAAMDLIAPEFEKAQGVTLALTYATPGRTREILEAGLSFDAGVIVAGVLRTAQADGLARDVSSYKVAISPVGMGVGQGLPMLDISSLAAFRNTIATLGSIGLSDPKAGTNLGLETLAQADRLGFGGDIRRKVRFFNGPGSAVSAAVARGETDSVITLASEIVPIPGVRFIGRLPVEMQTEYAMQALAPAKTKPSAKSLMDFLRGADAATLMRRVGLEPAA